MCQAKPESDSSGPPSLVDDDDEVDFLDDAEPVRGKWQLDGCKSLDDVITRLNDLIEYYTKLKNEGWELIETINDDWGHMRKNAQRAT